LETEIGELSRDNAPCGHHFALRRVFHQASRAESREKLPKGICHQRWRPANSDVVQKRHSQWQRSCAGAAAGHGGVQDTKKHRPEGVPLLKPGPTLQQVGAKQQDGRAAQRQRGVSQQRWGCGGAGFQKGGPGSTIEGIRKIDFDYHFVGCATPFSEQASRKDGCVQASGRRSTNLSFCKENCCKISGGRLAEQLRGEAPEAFATANWAEVAPDFFQGDKATTEEQRAKALWDRTRADPRDKPRQSVLERGPANDEKELQRIRRQARRSRGTPRCEAEDTALQHAALFWRGCVALLRRMLG
jgi:hypothetical protein